VEVTVNRLTLVVLSAAVVASSPIRVAAAELSPQLAPLKPLVGKTWRGVFPESKPDKPVVDVSRFEVALNGQAVRNLHSINDGSYGGETLIVWDKEKQAIVYYYFTTGGFYTTGTMKEEDGALVTHELVKGEADGISEVKAVFRLLPDGRLHAKTRYLKQGQWVDARDMHYVETPTAVVKFKE
jgi:hypothetical protein